MYVHVPAAWSALGLFALAAAAAVRHLWKRTPASGRLSRAAVEAGLGSSQRAPVFFTGPSDPALRLPAGVFRGLPRTRREESPDEARGKEVDGERPGGSLDRARSRLRERREALDVQIRELVEREESGLARRS